MAITKTRRKPDPAAMYVCIETFASADPLIGANAGDRLRGDDPTVVAHAEYFAPADTPRREWVSPSPGPGQLAQERSEALFGECDTHCWPAPRPLAIDAVRLTRPLKVAVGLKVEDKEIREFAAGTLFAPDDPLVINQAVADAFEPAQVEGAAA